MVQYKVIKVIRIIIRTTKNITNFSADQRLYIRFKRSRLAKDLLTKPDE